MSSITRTVARRRQGTGDRKQGQHLSLPVPCSLFPVPCSLALLALEEDFVELLEQRFAALDGVAEVGFAQDIQDGRFGSADGGVAGLALKEGFFAEESTVAEDVE